MKYYLNNPKANCGHGVEIPGIRQLDMTKIDYRDFFSKLKEDDEVVLIGGDGTINFFINQIDCTALKNNVYLFGNGSGNDFLNDINEKPGREILLNPYIAHLPTVKVNGKELKYVNNIGLGIDGYVAEGTDIAREKNPDKNFSYTAIALRGLLYEFKPFHVWLEIDGKEYEYDDVWLAPSMMGRFYGGGMMAAPGQDRSAGKLTVVICTSRSRLRLLTAFPKIFRGQHVKYTKMIKFFTGNRIHVRISSPCCAMIDGETVKNVTEYWAEL